MIDIMPSDLGNIHWKLANALYGDKQQKPTVAEHLAQAKKLVDGESNKEKIEKMLSAIQNEKLSYGGKGKYGRKNKF